MKVVRNEVIKLLDNGIIYPISDSKWVSPTQVVPKKSGVTVIRSYSCSLSLYFVMFKFYFMLY